METGQVLHIIVNVMAILGAGAVALVCDLLKTNNERLRQMNTELRIRREEEQRRTELALDQLRRMSHASVSRTIASRRAPTLTVPVSPEEQTNQIQRAGDTLEEARALARQILVTTDAAAEARLLGETANAEDSCRGAGRNWDALLKSGQSSAPSGPGKHRGELIPFESLRTNQELLHLPPGLHEPGELNYLLESRSPVRGTVVAIGVNGLGEAPSVADYELLEVITGYLHSLLKPGEFACQRAIDEYVIVSPELDSAAQRRFNELAGKLCDSDLRRPATNCNLFICGGFEANGESLSEAVGIAAQKMRNSRDLQTTPALETAHRRKVV